MNYWLTLFVVNGGKQTKRVVSLAKWKTTQPKEQNGCVRPRHPPICLFMAHMGGRHGGKLTLPVELWLLAVIVMWVKFHFWSRRPASIYMPLVLQEAATFNGIVGCFPDSLSTWNAWNWLDFHTFSTLSAVHSGPTRRVSPGVASARVLPVNYCCDWSAAATDFISHQASRASSPFLRT